MSKMSQICFQHEEVPTYFRPVVGFVCVLSLLGSSIVILTYFLSKENQTLARTILVHLSLNNIGQVVASLIGIIADLNHKPWKPWTDWCKCQALATMYFNVSGMLWTAGLAVHLYLLILGKRNYIRHFVWYLSVLCYLLPMVVAGWLLLTDRLGYAPLSMPGYCGLAGRTGLQYVSIDDRKKDCYPLLDFIGEILGYNLWVILTIAVVLLLYVSALCHLKLHVSYI